MRAGRLLPLAAILACLLLPTVGRAQVCKSIWGDPYSWVTSSDNGEFSFVLLCHRDTDEYLSNLRKGWAASGLVGKDAARMEKAVARNLEEEKQLRIKYKLGGLYRRDNPAEPVFKVESFPPEVDSIHVADNGSFVVGFNPHVFVPNMSAVKPEDVKGSGEAALIALSAQNSGAKPCSYKIADLGLETNSIQKTSDGYRWADEKASLDTGGGSFRFNKLNGDRLALDVKTCKIECVDGQGRKCDAPPGGSTTNPDAGSLLSNRVAAWSILLLLSLTGLSYYLLRLRKTSV